MIVYISGPITGLPHFNTFAFQAAESKLKQQGHIVLNPRNLPLGLTYAAYMDIAMAQVRAADAVYTLEGWTKSKGAKAEVAYAASIGKQLIGEPE
jgi:hypothetical protein